jgi:hypothetical protein
MDYKEQLEAALRGHPRSVQRAQRRPAKTRPAHVERKPPKKDRRLDVASILGLVVFLVTLVPLIIAVTPLVTFVSGSRNRSFKRVLLSSTLLGGAAAFVLVALAYYGVLSYWPCITVASAVVAVRTLVLPSVLILADTAAKHPFVRW